MKSELQECLKDQKLDAILIMGGSEHNPPMLYFTPGAFFTRAIIGLTHGAEPVLFHRPMERDTATKTGLDCVCLDQFPTQDFLKQAQGDTNQAEAMELHAILNYLGVPSGRIAICGKMEFGKQFAMVQAFQALYPQYQLAGSEGIDVIQQLRYTKDARELAAIRAMGERVVDIVGRVEQFIRSGSLKGDKFYSAEGKPVTIGEIKQMINLRLSELGGENPEGTIFSMGRDAGVPHNAGNDDELLQAGKTIVFDFFPCEAGGGYFYDFTRTWAIGYASEELQKAYDQVKLVHDRVIESIEAGQPLKQLQEKTCELFHEMGHVTVKQDTKTQSGYVHSVSHGLGLDVHERPFSGFSAPDSDRMDIGTVFTVEPGLYYPEAEEPFGIRLEDTIMIDPDGKARVMVDYPYQLVIPVSGKAA